MYIYIISTLFKILFPYRSLQSIEKSSLCYTVGPYQLSILYIVVCICQSQSPNLSFPPSSPLVTISSFSTSVTLFLSTIKKSEIIPFAVTWRDLEIIILSGVSQIEKNKCHMIYHLYGESKKMVQMNLFTILFHFVIYIVVRTLNMGTKLLTSFLVYNIIPLTIGSMLYSR